MKREPTRSPDPEQRMSSLTMHQASSAVMIRMLKNLARILAKAESHATAAKIDPKDFMEARLAPDMFPLTRQIQVASDAAKFCAARLSGATPPSWPDTEASFAELQARIATTISYLESVPAAAIDGTEDKTITVTLRGKPVEFTGRSYLLNFAMPNFMFHVTTAYAILRHKGVEIGKADYLGGA
jgi:hypothetical protein